MKRATTKLISCSKITTSSTSISGNFTTQFTTSSSSISNSPIQQSCTQTLKPCSNSNALFYKPYKTHHFHNNPSQNYSTHVGITPYFPSNHSNNNTHVGITPYIPFNQRKIKKSSNIAEFLETAKSAEEMLEAFKKMEGNLDESEIGFACMLISFQLNQEGKDPEKIVSFANRALSVFDKEGENKCYLFVASILQLLGSINYSLRKYNDALGFLNRAKNILVKLEDDGKYDSKDIKPLLLHHVLMMLADVYGAKGMIEAYMDNLRKALEIKEVLMGKDSREFGNANRDFAIACVGSQDFKDGLLYCLKALKIHLALLGENSVEVGHDRRVLGAIYNGMEEYKKALEEFQLAQKVYKNCGCSSYLDRAVIDAANVNIALGRYEDAMNTLKGVVQDSENQFHILTSIGAVLIHQEKFADAKRCLENACSVLDKQDKSKPFQVFEAYLTLIKLYEAMEEFETSISLLKRALSLLEKLPNEQSLELGVSARIGWRLLLMGKVTQAIPYLESAAEIEKVTFGSKNFVLGYVYNNLGVAYLELERTQLAAQMFAAAKDIMDASSLGPHHNDSIQACQNLSKAYAAMKSYPLAIEFQQKAVDVWESHGRSEEDELREARQLLQQLKASARGASTKDYPTKTVPLPYVRADRRDL
ncbi:protein KINESIN LIGHT CHAIN-RELATED 2-like [Silene latifolia]|uniref:protein KINESIN LIGHT CHAIN-RELATED 2-like n=1 Tax=Silene latifolia TaxID=37657 RepID=UPI003D7871D8